MSGPMLFGAEALTALVQRTLEDTPTIPDGAHGAFVTVANQDGIKAVIALRIAEQWQVSAVVSRAWREDADVQVGVTVQGTF